MLHGEVVVFQETEEGYMCIVKASSGELHTFLYTGGDNWNYIGWPKDKI